MLTVREEIKALLYPAGVLVLFLGLLIGGWYFFFGQQFPTEIAVAVNGSQVYKRWSMTRIIETYVSEEHCTTRGNQRSCHTDYDWIAVRSSQSSGVFRQEVPVEPPLLTFHSCLTVVANAGCERERLIQNWLVRFDGARVFFWCTVQRWQWEDDFLLGSQWVIGRNRAQGWLCPTIRRLSPKDKDAL